MATVNRLHTCLHMCNQQLPRQLLFVTNDNDVLLSTYVKTATSMHKYPSSLSAVSVKGSWLCISHVKRRSFARPNASSPAVTRIPFCRAVALTSFVWTMVISVMRGELEDLSKEEGLPAATDMPASGAVAMDRIEEAAQQAATAKSGDLLKTQPINGRGFAASPLARY